MTATTSKGVAASASACSSPVRSPLVLDVSYGRPGNLVDAAHPRGHRQPAGVAVALGGLPRRGSRPASLRRRRGRQLPEPEPPHRRRRRSRLRSPHRHVARQDQRPGGRHVRRRCRGHPRLDRLRVEQPPQNTVPFTLWRLDGGSANSWRRDLEVPEWADIAANYPDRTTLGSLMELRSVAGTGDSSCGPGRREPARPTTKTTRGTSSRA